MRDTTNSFDLSENDMLSYDVPDETLEIAAGSGPENSRAMTVAMCTGLDVCPY
jgi:hypothetical protein